MRPAPRGDEGERVSRKRLSAARSGKHAARKPKLAAYCGAAVAKHANHNMMAPPADCWCFVTRPKREESRSTFKNQQHAAVLFLVQTSIFIFEPKNKSVTAQDPRVKRETQDPKETPALLGGRVKPATTL